MIPSKVHFVWLGDSIPWAYVFAVMSTVARGEVDEVILHHSDPLKDLPATRALRETPGVRLAPMDGPAWMSSLARHGLPGDRLADIYRRVTNPVARSNMLRAAAVVDFGGIYLDLDTVTVASLKPLLNDLQFVGAEHIAWPHFVRSSKSPLLWARSGVLDAVRFGLRVLPSGYRWFPAIERAYYLGVNGAILGGEAGSPFLCTYLNAMAEVPEEKLLKKHALGTHLLQQQVDAYRAGDLTVHPPALFYPLSPEISEHWFRITPGLNVDPRRALQPTTRIAHWYASVRTKPVIPKISPEYVRAHAKEQLYSALIAEILPQYA